MIVLLHLLILDYVIDNFYILYILGYITRISIWGACAGKAL